MTIVDYYKWVHAELKNNKNGDDNIDLMNYTTGLTEECGEIMKIINKTILHKDVDTVRLLDECGDYLWYMVAYHCLVDGNYINFANLLGLSNKNNKGFMEINVLICDNAKLQGLYRKRLFLGKTVEDSTVKEVYERCLFRFLELLKYFNFYISDVFEYNVDKLNSRYPNGRTSNFYIELKFTEKYDKN